jgi:hypothetical protein
VSDLRVYGLDELGRDGYPPQWHKSIKHAVRQAIGHRCVRCGHPYRNGEHGNGEWSPCDERCTHGDPVRDLDGVREAQWRILTVHHLTGDKLDCRWWNLAALCQRCHLQIQGKVRMERVWPGEHTPWFRPYVAGYYAWTYLRQDLDRDDTIARLDELLALERQPTLLDLGKAS